MSKLDGLKTLLSRFEVGGKTVLDAGTGVGAGALALALLQPAKVVSVSLNASDFDEARAQIPDRYLEVIEFVQADLSDLSTIADGTFDLCLADYLVSAIDVYTPGQHEAVFAELRRVLRPGGSIIATDAEPQGVASESRPLADLRALWADVGHVAGKRPYGEYAPAWTEDLLTRAGFDGVCHSWVGSEEERGESFVDANAAGLERVIAGLLNDDRERFETRRIQVIEHLRAAVPLRGPVRYSVWGTKPALAAR